MFSFDNSSCHLWRSICKQIILDFFSYLSELVLCPCNNSKLGRRSKMTSPFLFPSCHGAVTWKSFQGSVFFLAYRQIFIVQEFGVRTKHWWQGPWKVELHSFFFQLFMFSTQQRFVFQKRQLSTSLLYVGMESCHFLSPFFLKICISLPTLFPFL